VNINLGLSSKWILAFYGKIYCTQCALLFDKDLLWTAPELLNDPALRQVGSKYGDYYSFGIICQVSNSNAAQPTVCFYCKKPGAKSRCFRHECLYFFMMLSISGVAGTIAVPDVHWSVMASLALAPPDRLFNYHSLRNLQHIKIRGMAPFATSVTYFNNIWRLVA